MRKGSLASVVTAALFWLSGARAADLQPGQPAPGFELLDQNGNTQRLVDYQGRWLVMYFYPKDDTPGCTKEACTFRDDILVFRRMGVSLLGVSTDDVASHQSFVEKYHLPFPLLSDPKGQVAAAYGALFSLGPLRFARRQSFIIDTQGRLARIYRDVDPKRHSEQVIQDLKTLGVGSEG